MNIWFDLSTSPHTNMFRVMINELQRDQCVTETCRPLATTIELLEMHGIRHTIVGTHFGRSLAKKIYGFPIRIAQFIAQPCSVHRKLGTSPQKKKIIDSLSVLQ